MSKHSKNGNSPEVSLVGESPPAIPLMTPDGRVVGVQIGDQIIGLQQTNEVASLGRDPDIDGITAAILQTSRGTLGALQHHRIMGQLARDIDYSDQPLGGPRKAVANFWDNRDHNRVREETIRAYRNAMAEVGQQRTDLHLDQVTFLRDLQQTRNEMDREWLQLSVERERLELELPFSESERNRVQELTKMDRTHAHEQQMALLQAGQQLPDLLRELEELQRKNPTLAVETTLALMRSALNSYQLMVTTTDKVAQAQMAEALKPMMAMVIQSALGQLKSGGQS